MFCETVFLGNELLRIELRDDMSYCLRYGNLVEYSNHGRYLRGRKQPYEFKSVEQLRYDFEEDVRRLVQGT
jgi:hypothetical protein